MNNITEKFGIFKKDFVLEIVKEKDSYTGRIINNIYIFLLEESIYEIDKVICNIDSNNFQIKLLSGNEYYIYNSIDTDKKDKKIFKFLSKYKENDTIDYSIIITNILDIEKSMSFDVSKIEMFRNKMIVEKEECKYEF